MLGNKKEKSYVYSQVAYQIAKYLGSLKKDASTRACLYCGRVFKLIRKNRYYCCAKCSRAAHYLKFQIRNIGD